MHGDFFQGRKPNAASVEHLFDHFFDADAAGQAPGDEGPDALDEPIAGPIDLVVLHDEEAGAHQHIEHIQQGGRALPRGQVDHLPRRSYRRIYEMLEQYDYPAAGTHGMNNDGRLYALGGVTGMKRNISDQVFDRPTEEVVTIDERGTKYGLHAGAGVEFAIGQSVALDVEMRYAGFVNNTPEERSAPGMFTTTAGFVVHF